MAGQPKAASFCCPTMCNVLPSNWLLGAAGVATVKQAYSHIFQKIHPQRCDDRTRKMQMAPITCHGTAQSSLMKVL
jgi:hypothetical protein